ncbi:hypothetical protein Agub_g12178 [Astrephomene gubernaculifera]|uniref:Uncharacterized protein n=1 Tax=Astrephomene gubernaculifera TaxID=47775 RepID=A0AAD3HR37_9CHLO|nr:hypothetical protein Agub_g12178 [Astrephomene gubernaculifera]
MASSLLPCHQGVPCRQALAAPCARSCRTKRGKTLIYASFKLSNLTSTGVSATARQQQNAVVSIDPKVATATSQASSSRGGLSLPVIALAAGALGLLAIVVKKLRNNGLDDNTYRYSANMHLADVMKDVNTVRIEDLSPDQIESARARRSKERANHKLSLEEIDLPQNHPFATKQKLSKEEQEQSLQNLRARSMRRRNYEAMQNGSEGPRNGLGIGNRQR